LGSIPSTNPDFLWSLVGSLHFMRLSLKKGAHVVLSRAAYRKSGESTGAPSFALFAKGGIVRSHPLTSHGRQTCSLGDLGVPARTHYQKKPRSQKRDLGHPLNCEGRSLGCYWVRMRRLTPSYANA